MKVSIYLGVDIGSTNIKFIGVDNQMNELFFEKIKTKTFMSENILYFDLENIIKDIESIIKVCELNYCVSCISFSSVGESVIPIKNGKYISNPIVWFDECTKGIFAKYKEIVQPFINENLIYDYSYSLFKIIYFIEILGINNPDCWLPISSFFIYYFTGCFCYDYSQASRTLLFDLDKSKWNINLFDLFNIKGANIDVKSMGSFIGFGKDGKSYYLGGHDHFVAIKGLRVYENGNCRLYDSIGTSESIVSFSNLNSVSTKVCYGRSYSKDEYYFIDGLHYSGKLIDCLSSLYGFKNVTEFCKSTNLKIVEEIKSLKFIKLNLTNSFKDVFEEERNNYKPQDILFSLYIYLAQKMNILIKKMEKNFSYNFEQVMIIGSVRTNYVYMLIRSLIIEKKMYCLDLEELGCYGSLLNIFENLDYKFVFTRMEKRFQGKEIIFDDSLVSIFKNKLKSINNFIENNNKN